jgi:hypothetical protein
VRRIEKDVSNESPETKLQRSISVFGSGVVVVFKSWRKSAPPSSALESQKPCKPRTTGQAAATLQVRKEKEDEATARSGALCLCVRCMHAYRLARRRGYNFSLRLVSG